MEDNGVTFSAVKKKKEYKKLGAYHSNSDFSKIIKSRLEAMLSENEKVDRVIDICCGSGNLLSVFEDSEKVGYDICEEFVNHCKDNIKGTFEVANVLKDKITSEKFDYVVGNYPFGLSDKELALSSYAYFKEVFNDLPDMPKSRLDAYFILKNLEILSDKGKAVIACSPGLFFRGNKEDLFREWLVNKGWIESLEVAEGKFFDDTKISVVIMCLNKSKTSKDIKFIEGDNTYTATYEDIVKNEYNLCINRYKEFEKEEEIDIQSVSANALELSLSSLKNEYEMYKLMEQTGLSGNSIPTRKQFIDKLKEVIKYMEDDIAQNP